MLFILSPKSGPRSDFLPNVVQFGLFLLSAIAYLKIAFYLCTSNPPKGVARSFKDFPPASLRSALVLRHAGHASATHEELKPLPPYTFPARTRKADQPATGPKPWTLETMPHPSRYDEKGLAGIGTRITRALPACDCTKRPRN